MDKAIFVGSFDPFTIGHDAIVHRALSFVNHLVIGVGVNTRKQCLFSAQERIDAIAKLYAGNPRVSVLPYDKLTIDFAKEVGAQCCIRAVRNANDFVFEQQQADINRQLGNLETLLLIAEPQYSHISSSMVRELIAFNQDVSPFIPQPLNTKQQA